MTSCGVRGLALHGLCFACDLTFRIFTKFKRQFGTTISDRDRSSDDSRQPLSHPRLAYGFIHYRTSNRTWDNDAAARNRTNG